MRRLPASGARGRSHFHGQITSEDLGLLENLGWFVEGLATYVSGQFDKSHAVRAREAVEDGLVPEQLTKTWTVPYRYGVAEAMGRRTFRDALKVTSQAALFALLGTTRDR